MELSGSLDAISSEQSGSIDGAAHTFLLNPPAWVESMIGTAIHRLYP